MTIETLEQTYRDTLDTWGVPQFCARELLAELRVRKNRMSPLVTNAMIRDFATEFLNEYERIEEEDDAPSVALDEIMSELCMLREKHELIDEPVSREVVKKVTEILKDL